MLTWETSKNLVGSFLFHALAATLLAVSSQYLRRLIDWVVADDSLTYAVFGYVLEGAFLFAAGIIILSGLYSLARGIIRAHRDS